MSSKQFHFGWFDLAIFCISAPGHLFILRVNFVDAIHSKTLNLSDQLICSISVVNILHQFLYVLELILFSLRKEMENTGDPASICFLILFQTLTSCNIWLSTWLCVHFCMRIVHINHRCYTRLQKMFHKTFKWILMSTVLGSSVISFPAVWGHLTSSNITVREQDQKFFLPAEEFFSHAFYSMSLVLPLVILFTSALTIIISLYRHMNRIQDNAEGSRTPNVDAHVRAIRTFLFLLVIYSFYFVEGVHFFAMRHSHIFEYFSIIFLAVSHILNPWILIKGNSKLDKALREVLHGWSCHQISNDV